jgi:hypothetical protein
LLSNTFCLLFFFKCGRPSFTPIQNIRYSHSVTIIATLCMYRRIQMYEYCNRLEGRHRIMRFDVNEIYDYP